MGKPCKKPIAELEAHEWIGGHKRGWNDACDAWEQWEKERPARWIKNMNDMHEYYCSSCASPITFTDLEVDNPNDQEELFTPKTCPGCGRKMEG